MYSFSYTNYTDQPQRTNIDDYFYQEQPFRSQGARTPRSHYLYSDIPRQTSMHIEQSSQSSNQIEQYHIQPINNPDYYMNSLSSSESMRNSLSGYQSSHQSNQSSESIHYSHEYTSSNNSSMMRRDQRNDGIYYCRVCRTQVDKTEYVDHCLKCSDQKFYETQQKMQDLSKDYNKMIEMRRQLPLTSQQLQQFAQISISEDKEANLNESERLLCSICRECFFIDSTVIVLNCQHQYHRECIEKWFQDSQKATCPLCQKNQNDYFFPKIPELDREDNCIRYHSSQAKNHFIDKFYQNH